MRTSVILSVIYLSATSLVAGTLIPVYLTAGRNRNEGRLELLYNATWGTVSNSKMTDLNCKVACRQLGYIGGKMVPDAVTLFGKGSGPVWLSDLTCTGTERYVADCATSDWGCDDCKHEDDVGCRCTQEDEQRKRVQAAKLEEKASGSCETGRHRIRPIDVRHPGVGRVELRSENGTWYVLCADVWDDIDAAVFCRCMGYTDKSHFRAYWSKSLHSLTPKLEALYSNIQCSSTDTKTIQNIWNCKIASSTALCDPVTGAAGIACQALEPATPVSEVKTTAKPSPVPSRKPVKVRKHRPPLPLEGLVKRLKGKVDLRLTSVSKESSEESSESKESSEEESKSSSEEQKEPKL